MPPVEHLRHPRLLVEVVGGEVLPPGPEAVAEVVLRELR